MDSFSNKNFLISADNHFLDFGEYFQRTAKVHCYKYGFEPASND